MNTRQKKKLTNYFKTVPYLKLVYFFGSRARADAGPMSDYDFAVYFDGASKSKMFDLQLDLIGKITKTLETDDVDVVVLNDVESPVLKHSIISDSQVLLEKEPFRVKLESQILAQYFDYNKIMHNHHLTKAKV